MKVIFDHSFPFFLAQDAFPLRIEQTKSALEAGGVEVEFLRWWDEGQRGDLFHYFGRPTGAYFELARQKQIRFVLADGLTGLGSGPPGSRVAHKALRHLARSCLPPSVIQGRFGWACYTLADACIALTPQAGQWMIEMYSASPERVHGVPDGVDPIFLNAPPTPRGEWLVAPVPWAEPRLALDLAEAAVLARTPLQFVGKVREEDRDGPFLQRVRDNPSLLRYEGDPGNPTARASNYRQARGFVGCTTEASLSPSVLEAAACACPLLLADGPWARSAFGESARFCRIPASAGCLAGILREFYDAAPGLPAAPRPPSWIEVGRRLKALYETVLSRPLPPRVSP